MATLGGSRDCSALNEAAIAQIGRQDAQHVRLHQGPHRVLGAGGVRLHSAGHRPAVHRHGRLPGGGPQHFIFFAFICLKLGDPLIGGDQQAKKTKRGAFLEDVTGDRNRISNQ